MDMRKVRWIAVIITIFSCFCPQLVFAATLDGSSLSAWWGVPFVAILLCVAIIPLLAPVFWHHHFGKVIAFWVLAFLVPFTHVFGPEMSLASFIHALVEEYIPFILLLLALYTVSGGIYIQCNVQATPLLNVGILLLGTVLASFMGTTGASMLLIRPLLRANQGRQRCAHVVIFFIFLVANIGGSLTPLGDPPLFLGFLKGISFFWTAQHLWAETLTVVVILLIIFYALDSFMMSAERKGGRYTTQESIMSDKDPAVFAVQGKINFIYLAAVIGLVLMSGIWSSDIAFQVLGSSLGLPDLVRDIGFVILVILSLVSTKKAVRKANNFTWAPMEEVSKLFAGIFLTIIPVIAMLKAGENGVFAPIVSAVSDINGEPIPLMYFWATGILSSFLDNAPTYLVFFNTASGDPQTMMTTMAGTLAAISAGAVFMGANTYIGNAPNLMVKSIADEAGVKMPSFFGYMAWSFGILVPLFILVSLIWYT